MAIRIKDIEELTEKIDGDIQWRKKELLDMKSFIHSENSSPVLLRAAFVLCCAHFEGSIRYASNAYIAYISSQGIKARDLRIELPSLIVRKRKAQDFKNSSSKKVKIGIVSDILQVYDDLLDQNFYIKLNSEDAFPEIDETDIPLPTEGNPSSDVLADISRILNLDYSDLFELRAPFIDGELLRPRHQVAHGERRPIRIEEFEEALNFVLEIMDKFKESIINAAINGCHMRFCS